jgi:hypothetical protein
MSTIVDGTSGVSLVQDGVVVQADLASNVAGTGPAFNVYQSTAQSLPATTATKLQFDSEDQDTANAFSAGIMVSNTDATNRFTPQVAGYYEFHVAFVVSTTATGVQLYIYKNGGLYRKLRVELNATQTSGSCLVYMNGTTDYVEAWGWQGAAAQNTTANFSSTWFQGYLVRKA